MVATSISLSPLPLTSISRPKLNHHYKVQIQPQSILALPSISSLTRTNSKHKHSIPPNPTQTWRISAIQDNNFLISEATPVETTEKLVTTTDDWFSSTIVPVLLSIAFVGLSILTLGVIYIAVTDFLQKREKEKFEKEEAALVKKRLKKAKKVRARARPRGFRLKIDKADDI